MEGEADLCGWIVEETDENTKATLHHAVYIDAKWETNLYWIPAGSRMALWVIVCVCVQAARTRKSQTALTWGTGSAEDSAGPQRRRHSDRPTAGTLHLNLNHHNLLSVLLLTNFRLQHVPKCFIPLISQIFQPFCGIKLKNELFSLLVKLKFYSNTFHLSVSRNKINTN